MFFVHRVPPPYSPNSSSTARRSRRSSASRSSGARQTRSAARRSVGTIRYLVDATPTPTRSRRRPCRWPTPQPERRSGMTPRLSAQAKCPCSHSSMACTCPPEAVRRRRQLARRDLGAGPSDPRRGPGPAPTPHRAAAKSDFLGKADYFLVSNARAHGFTLVTHEVSARKVRRRSRLPMPAPPWVSCA